LITSNIVADAGGLLLMPLTLEVFAIDITCCLLLTLGVIPGTRGYC